jgi:hypothetical protein
MSAGYAWFSAINKIPLVSNEWHTYLSDQKWIFHLYEKSYKLTQ